MDAYTVRIVVENLFLTELSSSRFGKKYQDELTKASRSFFSWLDENKISDIRNVSKKNLIDYHNGICATISTLTGKPIQAGTVNTRFLAVKRLFSLAYRSGVISRNPCHNLYLDLPDNPEIKRRPFAVDELDAFLERLDTTTPKGLRDRALFELIYSSGLRVCEVSRLLIGDIDFQRREMLVHGKFSRDRLVPISEVAATFLQKYLDKRIANRDEPVFKGQLGAPMRPMSVSRRFSDLLKDFDMKKDSLSAHSIRHSTATHLLDNGASIRHIQELLGHRNIDTTERYTHLQTESVARAYRKYHPREHELFELVDEQYLKRLSALLDSV
jgi:integrase/recombinase XerD